MKCCMFKIQTSREEKRGRSGNFKISTKFSNLPQTSVCASWYNKEEEKISAVLFRLSVLGRAFASPIQRKGQIFSRIGVEPFGLQKICQNRCNPPAQTAQFSALLFLFAACAAADGIGRNYYLDH